MKRKDDLNKKLKILEEQNKLLKKELLEAKKEIAKGIIIIRCISSDFLRILDNLSEKAINLKEALDEILWENIKIRRELERLMFTDSITYLFDILDSFEHFGKTFKEYKKLLEGDSNARKKRSKRNV